MRRRTLLTLAPLTLLAACGRQAPGAAPSTAVVGTTAPEAGPTPALEQEEPTPEGEPTQKDRDTARALSKRLVDALLTGRVEQVSRQEFTDAGWQQASPLLDQAAADRARSLQEDGVVRYASIFEKDIHIQAAGATTIGVWLTAVCWLAPEDERQMPSGLEDPAARALNPYRYGLRLVAGDGVWRADLIDTNPPLGY